MYFGNLSAVGHGFDFCVIAIVVLFDSELWLAFGSVLWCVDCLHVGAAVHLAARWRPVPRDFASLHWEA